MSAQAEDADMPPLADAPPMQPAEESKQPETTKAEEEGSDEDAPLIEPLTILKLLHGFCGDGTQDQKPTSARRPASYCGTCRRRRRTPA